MGNAKSEREELKKLEDEAYTELCQIIAEAMQYQDITLLDQRIVDWKKKYKKLLDSSSSASTNFKKRIEYLLNEYYSEITQYILKQIRKSEEKRIENQSKALKKLCKIIDETDDLDLLKEKVKEWENKYPISAFLNMYQKRIKIYTSKKYLEENAFDQDKAFYDLYYITKLNRTYDEFKEEIAKWEDNYSIHDKFELDDFIKNQSDVIRYTSDEYLMSIAHEDNKKNQENILPIQKNPDSSLSKQASAYSALISIARKPNNIDEIFNWVYKNNSIKFNDEYRDLILRAISLDYSPAYLNSLSIPKINLSSSLSFEEYQHIDEIKRYAVISYFNLLLPPEEAISNNYFNKYVEEIYNKSRAKKIANNYNQEAFSIPKEEKVVVTEEPKVIIPEEEKVAVTEEPKVVIPEEEKIAVTEEPKVVISEEETVTVTEEPKIIIPEEEKVAVTEEPKVVIPEEEKVAVTEEPKVVISEEEKVAITEEPKVIIPEEEKVTVTEEPQEFEEKNESLSSDTIIALSPSFFEIMNNKIESQQKQSEIITMIDTHVQNYMSMTIDKTNDISKTKFDSI